MLVHHARFFFAALLLSLSLALLFPSQSQGQNAAEYRRRATVLRQAVQRCNQRLLSGDITSCTVDVGFGLNRTISMPEAIKLADEYDVKARQADIQAERAWCNATRERYARDMEAIRRMQKTIQMGQQELDEWTKRNEQAQWDALKAACNLLVDGGLAYIAESGQVLNGLKGALAKYEKQLKRQRRPVDPLQQAKWIDMKKRAAEMEIAIDAARKLQNKKEKAEIFWGYFTASTKDVDESTDAFKRALNAAEDDPILHKLLADKGLMPMVNRLKTKQLMPTKPYLVNLLEFVKDYGYSATEWVASRNRIIQQYNVSDEQLKAVNAMQEHLKRTMASVNECVSRGFITRP